jgi:hypothetical protein
MHGHQVQSAAGLHRGDGLMAQPGNGTANKATHGELGPRPDQCDVGHPVDSRQRVVNSLPLVDIGFINQTAEPSEAEAE